jgi:p21-activated kinase 1
MIEGEASWNRDSLETLYPIATNGSLLTTANPENLSSTFRDYLATFDAVEPLDMTKLLRHPFFALAEPLRTLVPLIEAVRGIT